MVAFHWPSILCVAIVSSATLVTGDSHPLQRSEPNGDYLESLRLDAANETTSAALFGIKLVEDESHQPKSRQERAVYKQPGCIITIDDAEAAVLSKMLRGMMSIFTQKPQAVTPTVEPDNEIRYSCDSGVSNVKASIWFILNRVWLATSCQYPDGKAYQQARSQVEREGKKVGYILYNVDVRSPEGSILLDTYASAVKEVETMLEDALDTMDRVQRERQCNSVNVKQVAEVFEAGMQEILSLKTAMEAQRKQTEEALEALAAQREETKKALEEVESLTS